jgi:ppGpp synthetase/RelA/SpoT-type nucleotidyltranferase
MKIQLKRKHMTKLFASRDDIEHACVKVMASPQPTTDTFDFEAHKDAAVERYEKLRPFCEEFADVMFSILDEVLETRGIKVASIESRAKPLNSFGKKASEPSPSDPSQPKYKDPLSEIQDLTGARIITFFPSTIDQIDRMIAEEFVVIEKTNKADLLLEKERFGYQSVHYIAKLKPNRTSLPEYRRFADLVAEIQVRTILQHAWAEIEHDIQYKSVQTIPSLIRRRFMSLAGLLELADREFQAIQDEDEHLRQAARISVEEGKLESVEITPDALKAYLDKRLGPDRRMTPYSYHWTAEGLRKMGFVNFRQIYECIANYDDDQVSRIVWGSRQGQLTRFDLLLLAGMGEQYLKRYPFNQSEGFKKSESIRLDRLRDGGIEIRDYAPPHE